MYEQRHRSDLKEALEFAERMANQEIGSIDRLHQRTIRQLSILAGVFLLLLGVFGGVLGWVGFTNLRDSAIKIAQAQMKDEVSRQVQEKLTKEHIDQIVQDQIRSYSKSSLDSAIKQDLQTEPLSTEIRNAATGAARNLVGTMFSQRHFT